MIRDDGLVYGERAGSGYGCDLFGKSKKFPGRRITEQGESLDGLGLFLDVLEPHFRPLAIGGGAGRKIRVSEDQLRDQHNNIPLQRIEYPIHLAPLGDAVGRTVFDDTRTVELQRISDGEVNTRAVRDKDGFQTGEVLVASVEGASYVVFVSPYEIDEMTVCADTGKAYHDACRAILEDRLGTTLPDGIFTDVDVARQWIIDNADDLKRVVGEGQVFYTDLTLLSLYRAIERQYDKTLIGGVLERYFNPLENGGAKKRLQLMGKRAYAAVQHFMKG